MRFSNFYKYVTIVACFFSATHFGFSQNSEFGIFLGGSYYNGELNPRNHFVGVTKPAFGIFHDAHINSRYSWRTMASFAQLYAHDNLTNIGLNNFRDLQFETNLYELSGQIHFNFFPYGFSINELPYTPYLFLGVSVFHAAPHVSSLSMDSTSTALPKEDYNTTLTSVSIPMGFGFKAILGTFTLGVEWSIRKTFTDKLDGIDNQYQVGNTNDPSSNPSPEPDPYPQPKGFQKGSFNANDWYSYAGFTVSFRPKPKKNACPR